LTGRYAIGLPASEIWLNPGFSFPSEGRGLLIAVSRSGETTETIRACHFFQSKGYGDVVTLTCYPDQPMASMGNLNLVFPSGQEKSVAQTRAFSTLYLSAIAIAALFSHRTDIVDQLSLISSSGRKVLQEYRTKLCDLGRNEFLDRFYFLGSGLRYGLASEISLKMKEMSLSHSEPFHFMEFRHGPKSMVTENILIFGLISNENHAYEKAVLDEMQSLGGFVLSVGENDSDVNFNSKMHEVVSSILYLPIGQTLALSRSLFKGLNPDLPHNLTTVVKL
jgi:glucosamine--fructose-6-phosphate aminotransferase (isomerizing)